MLDTKTAAWKKCDLCGKEGFTPGYVALSEHTAYTFKVAQQEPPKK